MFPVLGPARLGLRTLSAVVACPALEEPGSLLAMEVLCSTQCRPCRAGTGACGGDGCFLRIPITSSSSILSCAVLFLALVAV